MNKFNQVSPHKKSNYSQENQNKIEKNENLAPKNTKKTEDLAENTSELQRYICEVNITSDQADQRLDKWFKRNFNDFPFTELAILVRKSKVRINGKKTTVDYRLQADDCLSFPKWLKQHNRKHDRQQDTQKSKESLLKSPKFQLLSRFAENWLIYRDPDVLVLNKPAGIAVQGGSRIDISLDDLLENFKFESLYRPKLVHRLDKETSGLLLLGRNLKSAAWLSKAFREREVHKKYLAILCGVPKEMEGVVNMPLSKNDSESMQSNKRQDRKNSDIFEESREAITIYRVLDHDQQYSLVELQPITGRNRQIRIHMSMLGCPVLGDQKSAYMKQRLQDYASNSLAAQGGEHPTKATPSLPAALGETAQPHAMQPPQPTQSPLKANVSGKIPVKQMFLHAWQLDLHINNKKLQLIADLPEYFQNFIAERGFKL